MIRQKDRTVLGPDAVTVLERLFLVPFEDAGEVAKATGLPLDRVEAAFSKLRALGLVEFSDVRKDVRKT